jgi:hypothetical protein
MRLTKRLERGAEAGIAGGMVVAFLLLARDVLHLDPLSTPEALAAGFFGPGGYFIEIPVVAGIVGGVAQGARVLAFTVLHFLIFSVLGVAASFVLTRCSISRTVFGGIAFGLTACTAVFYAGRLFAGSPFHVDQISVTSVLLVNACAGAMIALVLQLCAESDDRKAVSDT